MAKQIKIGFDKIPAPEIEKYEPLYDLVSGTPLTDSAGVPLVTLENSTLALYNTKTNSTSVVINNLTNDTVRETIKIEEQFPNFSEVSNTLLGVERAETQLSLFSDVSSYGFDANNWEYQTYSSTPAFPAEWYTREHPQLGSRYFIDFKEETREQALYLSAFPVQFTYPWPPGTDRYNAELYRRYMKFIAYGKILWHYWAEEAEYLTGNSYRDFANENFIPPNIRLLLDEESGQEIKFVDDVNGRLLLTIEDARGDVVPTGLGEGGTALGIDSAYKVDYTVNFGLLLQRAFNQIEKWTIAFYKIIDDNLQWPDPTLRSSTLVDNMIEGIKTSILSDIPPQPGYSSKQTIYGTLLSKQSYRYQPGRISGFTYGLRGVTNPAIENNFIEWGCSNTTDEYMFQLKGANLNIVRRSTIPLPPELLERMGLLPRDQKGPQARPGFTTGNDKPLYETIIPRDKFTDDKLDGTGPSGYNIDITKVTMYKIEFGWYGAIGAQFYAYVPVGNDECRWVLIHRITIENGIDRPCLENPNFRFKYFVSVDTTDKIYEPVYLYKYGASYYIDGGDEGTSQINSGATEAKQYRFSSPTVAIFPKETIRNSFGREIINDKKVYLQDVSAYATEVAEIKLQEIVGSPEGQHFHYSPSLKSGISENSSIVNLQISPERDRLFSIPDPDVPDSTAYQFQPSDNEKKIIAPQIFNAYIGYDDTNAEAADVLRRNNYIISDGDALPFFYRLGFQNAENRGRQFEARLSGYDTVVASTIPLGSNFFKIHFLNPVATENYGQYSEFAIALTNKTPQLVSVTDPDITLSATEQRWVDEESMTEVLRFGSNKEPFDLYSEAYAEFSQYEELPAPVEPRDLGEARLQTGELFQLSRNLPNPDGEDSGIISGIIGKVEIITTLINRVEDDDQGANFKRLYFLTKQAAPVFDPQDAADGTIELGSRFEATGIKVVSGLIEEGTDEVDLNGDEIMEYYYIIDISSAVPGKYDHIVDDLEIQTKVVLIQDNSRTDVIDIDGNLVLRESTVNKVKIGSWSIQPLYVVFALRDNAQVNNIIFEEIRPAGNITYTPTWIHSSITYEDENGQGNIVDPIVLSGGSSMDLEPCNFFELDRQSSVLLDTQVTQPLRPPRNILFTSFVDSNRPDKIDLKSYFGEDRVAIQPSALNNVVYFLTAQSLTLTDGSLSDPGQVELSLTIKEKI